MYLLLVTLGLTIYLYYNVMYKRRRDQRLIKEFPPVGLEFPLIGSAWRLVGNSEALMTTLSGIVNAAVKLGGVARMSILTVHYIVLSDAQDAAFALKTSLEKDYVYTLFQFFSGNGSAFNTDRQIAKERRAVLVPSFHPNLLFSFVDTFWEESVKLSDTLAGHAGKGPFPAGVYLHDYILRSVLRTGVDISDGDIYCEEFIEVLRNWEVIAGDRLVTIWKHPDFLYRWHPQYTEGEKIVKTAHMIAQKILNRRIEELGRHSGTSQDTKNSPYPGIFDSIINSDLEEIGKREEILIVIIGTDLVSFAIGFTLVLLGLYPDVQDKVYRELQEIFDTDRPVSKEDLSRLRYLDMVTKESMRLYPPVPIVARKVTKEITLPSGRTIPVGTGLIPSMLGVHRNPRYWGPDADSFDPDRFSPDRFKNVPPEAFMPFSYGPRNCVGYKFGQISMKVALATILRRYKIVGRPADGPVPRIRTKIGIYMRAADDFKIEIVERH